MNDKGGLRTATCGLRLLKLCYNKGNMHEGR